jgi:hypothetical protein
MRQELLLSIFGQRMAGCARFFAAGKKELIGVEPDH